jgi:hypothetical protein
MDGGRKQEENVFHNCVIIWVGNLLVLYTCPLFRVNMWLYALLDTLSFCVDVAYQGVCHGPKYHVSLIDWTFC